MKMLIRFLSGTLCLGVLAGCAGQSLNMAGVRAQTCTSKPDKELELSLNLAKEMAGQGRLYAALANLQGLSQASPDVRLAEARIMRTIGRGEAKDLYQSLTGTCLAAAGEHGLGQLAAARGDQLEAQTRLERARVLAPTDAKVRNDLGVVYLRQGRADEARFEFLTALELDQSAGLAAQNLLTLLFFQDQWQQAAELVSRLGLSPQQVRSAEQRSRSLKSADLAQLPVEVSDSRPAASASSLEPGPAVSRVAQGVKP